MFKSFDAEMQTTDVDGTSHWGMPTWRKAVEMAVLFATAGLLHSLIQSSGSAIDVGINLSVFWLPVVIMSVQYGLVEGLASAVIAIAARSLLEAPVAVVGDSLITSTLRTGTEPMLWIAFAVLVGGFRTRQHFGTVRAEKEAGTHRDRSNLLAKQYGQLQLRAESLERYVATRMATVGSGESRTGAPDIHSQSPQECISALFAAFILALEGATFRIYIRDGDVLARLRENRGHRLSRTDIVGPGNPLYEAIVVKRITICDTNGAGLFPASFNGIYACPITAGDQGQVVGMLLVESIHPSRLTDEYQEFYRQLCSELGDALAQRGYSDLVEGAQSFARMDGKAKQIGRAARHSIAHETGPTGIRRRSVRKRHVKRVGRR